ncbi:MAG: hypothetical protein Q4C91_15050 [Eubacteriales bacterium]|nr:hypothetical protein [Eubacteriales bacterium]
MRQVYGVVRFNFMGFFKNTKVILTFLLVFLLCYLLSERVMAVIEVYQTPVQAAEPFLWSFGDSWAILLSSLLLSFLFSDLPKLSPLLTFYLVRMTKKKWLLGQLIYISIVTAIYTVVMFLSTILLCMKWSYIGNIWSETAAMLGYSGLWKSMNIPSTVKAMENITPYGCMLQAALLIFGYTLSLSLLILTGNLAFGKNRGLLLGLLYSLYGFLLNPKVLCIALGMKDYEMPRANVLAGWLSPLSHAVYARHSFGYDMLPTVGQSCAVFGILTLFLSLASLRALKQYNFTFPGEKT